MRMSPSWTPTSHLIYLCACRLPIAYGRPTGTGSHRTRLVGTVGNIPPEVFYTDGIANKIQDTFALGAMAGAIFAKESLRQGLLFTDNIFSHEASRAFGLSIYLLSDTLREHICTCMLLGWFCAIEYTSTANAYPLLSCSFVAQLCKHICIYRYSSVSDTFGVRRCFVRCNNKRRGDGVVRGVFKYSVC